MVDRSDTGGGRPGRIVLCRTRLQCVPLRIEDRVGHGIIDSRHAVLHARTQVAHKHIIRAAIRNLPDLRMVETREAVATHAFLPAGRVDGMFREKIQARFRVNYAKVGRPVHALDLESAVGLRRLAGERSGGGSLHLRQVVSAPWDVAIVVARVSFPVPEPHRLAPHRAEAEVGPGTVCDFGGGKHGVVGIAAEVGEPPFVILAAASMAWWVSPPRLANLTSALVPHRPRMPVST